MGWADCGTDSKGRPIGYAYGATCDHEGCKEKIDRGLSYVCGDMHGDDEISCEKYFCEKHKRNYVQHEERLFRVCDECAKALINSGHWIEDEDEGVIIPLDN